MRNNKMDQTMMKKNFAGGQRTCVTTERGEGTGDVKLLSKISRRQPPALKDKN